MINDGKVQEVLASLSKEAVKLRFTGTFPDRSASPREVLYYLLDARKRVDRIEGIYLQVITIRASIFRQASALTALAEEAWVEAMSAVKPVTRGGSFVGPREKYAEADLATLQEKRASRKASELLSEADETSDIVRTALKGLNDTISDLKVWIRSLQFQSHIET